MLVGTGCQPHSAPKSIVQERFDSCYAFARQYSLDRRAQADTLEEVLKELCDADTLLLTEAQRKQQIGMYRALASHYLSLGQNDLMLATLRTGEKKAAQSHDAALNLSYTGALISIYASWRMKEQTHYYIDRAKEQLESVKDTIARCDALLIISGAYCNEGDTEAALDMIDKVDQLVEANPSLPARFSPNLRYLYPYMRGWVLASVTARAQEAVEVLLPLYTQYLPHKRQISGFDVICYNLATAYRNMGQTQQAEKFYQEALEIVIGQETLTYFDCTKWLMEHYLTVGDKQRMTLLLPTWNRLMHTFYSWCTSSQLTAYYVETKLAEKEHELEKTVWQLKVQRQANLLAIVVVAFLLALCIWGITFWLRRKRQMRQLFEALMRRHIEWKEQLCWLEERQRLLLGGALEEESPLSIHHALYSRILYTMEQEKPFLLTGFSLEDLVRQVGANRSQVSNCINQMAQRHFSIWLAEYRVNYLLELFYRQKGEHTHSLESLYAEAGFASRSSFYRQFKLITGLSPAQFIKHFRQNRETLNILI